LKIAALTLITCMAAASVMAQKAPADQSFTSRLQAARATLQVDDAGLHGPGATTIAEAVAASRYVLIGEDHLSREIPKFSVGICRLMTKDGLDAFAVEVGPEATRVVNANLRRRDRISRLSTFTKAHPDAFAFQNGRDESDMAAECARLAGPKFEIWGLDQEFFGAPGHLFEQMLAAHPGPTARAAVEKLSAAERVAAAKALASGSPSDLFLYKVTDQELQDADRAIKRDGGARVGALFASLTVTRSIYLSQNTDGYASNGRRARLMKRTLVQNLDTRGQPSRVLFKFGDAHMGKGINGLGQRDLGNFVAERAEGEGVGSLHIAVYGAKGVHALYGGVGRQLKQQPFVLTDYPSYAWLKDVIGADQRSASRDWTVIDLRLLRAKPPADMSPTWRDVARRYDLIVVAPELTPSSLVAFD
jgi:hypothetical protein